MALHINIEDLLSARIVESDRIEYKEGWNPDPVYRSICAFANDFHDTGGGYILIGVTENPESKTALRPVKGLSTNQIGAIQLEMIGYNNLFRPHYAPRLFIEQIDDRQIIVLWVVPGSERPYEIPESVVARHKTWKYYIRRYASSIEAKGADREELINLLHKIPFDDRANAQASFDDISMVLVQDHLRKIDSKLAHDIGKLSNVEVLQQMALLSGPVEHLSPRNVSLMMFSDNPARFFPYTQVEIVSFPLGEAADFIEYPPIIGPIPEQIKATLDFLKTNLLQQKISKLPDQAQSIRIWNYPLQAIEEILVNSFYHRDYQVREPIEIRIYANSIVFINYGGPDRSIQMQAFLTGSIRSRRYRNRRLGDFLKELQLTEGRATGIPTILRVLKDNGSSPPRFTTDENRTFFEVELFVHPAFKLLPPIDINVQLFPRSKLGIDQVLNAVLEQVGTVADNDVSTIAATIANDAQDIDNVVVGILDRIPTAIAAAIADAIADAIALNELKLITIALQPVNRETLLAGIKLQNHRKNYEEHAKPLIDTKWLVMTIPLKPTSPKQQYLTTLKGRLVLQFLKHKSK